MRVAVKPVLTTSVALAGAGALAVAPLQQPVSATTARVVEQHVSLAADSLAYVPVNAIEQGVSAPANMVAALDRLATALVVSGSWNESHPNNVWGWDPANPAMLRESINVLAPYPALSEPAGRHLNWWAAANLPMYEGCAYECADLPGMLDLMFKVPISDFYDEDGYTFPTVVNPVDGQETEWSGEQVILDPVEPVRSVWGSLMAEPAGVETVTWDEIVTAVANFSAALQITGHLPDWIAVREIEQFARLVLGAPDEVAPSVTEERTAPLSEVIASPSDIPESPAGVPEFRTVGLSPAAAPPEPASDGPVSEPMDGNGPSVQPAALQIPIVEQMTDELKQKFESAPAVDESAGTTSEEEDAEDSRGQADHSVTDETFDQEQAADQDDHLGQDEPSEEDVEAADENDDETDSSTGSGGRHRRADNSSDDTAPQDKAGSSGESSDSSDSDSGDSKD